MQVVAEAGTYYTENSFAVPFKHFQNRLIWNVEVGNDHKVIYVRAIAETAEQAAHIALGRFENEYLPLDEENEDDA